MKIKETSAKRSPFALVPNSYLFFKKFESSEAAL